MTRYQIRIIRQDGQRLTIDARLMGDHAAIRRAKTFAMSGDLVEIWRDKTCVYETAAGTSAG